MITHTHYTFRSVIKKDSFNIVLWLSKLTPLLDKPNILDE